MTDTEALKALVAKWRNGPPELSEGARKIYCDYRRGCADELEVLVQRLLASPDAFSPNPETQARAPVDAVPVATLSELEGIITQVRRLRTDGFVNHGSYADKELEAIETRLSTIVKEQK